MAPGSPPLLALSELTSKARALLAGASDKGPHLPTLPWAWCLGSAFLSLPWDLALPAGASGHGASCSRMFPAYIKEVRAGPVCTSAGPRTAHMSTHSYTPHTLTLPTHNTRHTHTYILHIIIHATHYSTFILLHHTCSHTTHIYASQIYMYYTHHIIHIRHKHAYTAHTTAQTPYLTLLYGT